MSKFDSLNNTLTAPGAPLLKDGSDPHAIMAAAAAATQEPKKAADPEPVELNGTTKCVREMEQLVTTLKASGHDNTSVVSAIFEVYTKMIQSEHPLYGEIYFLTAFDSMARAMDRNTQTPRADVTLSPKMAQSLQACLDLARTGISPTISALARARNVAYGAAKASAESLAKRGYVHLPKTAENWAGIVILKNPDGTPYGGIGHVP